MMYSVGLDIGSLAVKTVILSQELKILGYDISLTAGSSKLSAEKSFKRALEKTGINGNDIACIVKTGYGRENVPFQGKSVTEIACHALGAYFLFPETRTVIDIGGQDSKVISLKDGGKVIDFVMNDKCAAGTGRFLEVMAQALDVPLESLGELSQLSHNIIPISSFCTVFAESEVVSLVAEGKEKTDIIKGLHEAIGEKTCTLLRKIKPLEPIIMTGGVAKNIGVVYALERRLNLKINVPQEPQIVGALGAAMIALKSIRNKFNLVDISKKS